MIDTNIYILVFPEIKSFKVGKADDVSSRLYQLEKVWGKCDRKESYSIGINSKDVFSLEKSLHMILRRHKSDTRKGDGYTELFKISALDKCIDAARLFSESMGLTISRNISKPRPKKNNTKTPARNHYKTRCQIAKESTNNLIGFMKLIQHLVSNLEKYNVCFEESTFGVNVSCLYHELPNEIGFQLGDKQHFDSYVANGEHYIKLCSASSGLSVIDWGLMNRLEVKNISDWGRYKRPIKFGDVFQFTTPINSILHREEIMNESMADFRKCIHKVEELIYSSGHVLNGSFETNKRTA